MIVRVGDLRPDDLDDSRSGFNKSPSQQAGIAERVATVSLSHFGGLGIEVERLSRPTGHDQAQSPVVILVERVILDGLIDDSLLLDD